MAMAVDVNGVDVPATMHLPYGRRIELPGRGTTFVREVEGPPGAPTVLLLHGWIATAGLNWFRVFDALGKHFRVLAPDMRGHGRGLRTRKVFRLHDCADDAAEMLLQLDTGPVIAVGYSMGGPVSQLLWRRHRDLVSGLVQCATAPGFMPGGRERVVFTTMMAALVGTTRVGTFAARVPGVPRRFQVAPTTRPGSLPAWAAAEVRRHDWRMILEAGHSIGTYHARWIGEVDVPTAVVLTTEDRAVPPYLQLNMAESIPDSTVHPVADGHVVCGKSSFAPPVVNACLDVAERIGTRETLSR